MLQKLSTHLAYPRQGATPNTANRAKYCTIILVWESLC